MERGYIGVLHLLLIGTERRWVIPGRGTVHPMRTVLSMMKFTIRDIFWLTLVVAIITAWVLDRTLNPVQMEVIPAFKQTRLLRQR